MVYAKRIKSLRYKGHIYIPKDEPVPQRKSTRTFITTQTPNGFLPLREWCKKYKQSYKVMGLQCRLESFPNVKINKYIFIKDAPKEDILHGDEARCY